MSETTSTPAGAELLEAPWEVAYRGYWGKVEDPATPRGLARLAGVAERVLAAVWDELVAVLGIPLAIVFTALSFGGYTWALIPLLGAPAALVTGGVVSTAVCNRYERRVINGSHLERADGGILTAASVAHAEALSALTRLERVAPELVSEAEVADLRGELWTVAQICAESTAVLREAVWHTDTTKHATATAVREARLRAWELVQGMEELAASTEALLETIEAQRSPVSDELDRLGVLLEGAAPVHAQIAERIACIRQGLEHFETPTRNARGLEAARTPLSQAR